MVEHHSAKRSSKGFSINTPRPRIIKWILVDGRTKVAGPAYTEYWNPIIRPSNSESRAHTRELSASGLSISESRSKEFEQSMQLDAARDLAREHATWVRGAANAFDRHDDSREAKRFTVWRRFSERQ